MSGMGLSHRNKVSGTTVHSIHRNSCSVKRIFVFFAFFGKQMRKAHMDWDITKRPALKTVLADEAEESMF